MAQKIKLPLYAAEFPLKQLPDQLCEDGPYLCPTCEVPCAFGLRFLREIDSDPRPGKTIVLPEREVPKQTIEAQRRVYAVLMDLAQGVSKEEVCKKYGYANKKQLGAAIRSHKEMALARFEGGKAPEVMGVGNTSPSLYHENGEGFNE